MHLLFTVLFCIPGFRRMFKKKIKDKMVEPLAKALEKA